MIHDIYQADSRKSADKAFNRFKDAYEQKYPKAVQKLVKTKDLTMTFYDFPAQHWPHIRSTNPIESMFSTLRLRTRKTKGCGSVSATLSMVFKLAECAEKRWKKLNGSDLLAQVIDARFSFKDGVIVESEVTPQVASNTNF